MKAIIVAAIVFVFLRFGLEPMAWFFYEVSHFLGVDALYWGYRGFRFADFAFSAWPYQTVACAVAALLCGGMVWLFSNRRKAR